MQELAGDDFQVDVRAIGSIPCDSVITALSYWEGKLFVGFGDRTVKVCLRIFSYFFMRIAPFVSFVGTVKALI